MSDTFANCMSVTHQTHFAPQRTEHTIDASVTAHKHAVNRCKPCAVHAASKRRAHYVPHIQRGGESRRLFNIIAVERFLHTLSEINTREYVKSQRFTVKKRENFLTSCAGCGCLFCACFLRLSCASHGAANWAATSATKVSEGEQEGPAICSHPASKLIQMAV